MLKTTIAFGLAALALTGCATQYTPEQAKNIQDIEQALATVRQAAQVSCSSQSECDRMWLLTRAYVEANSDMRVRVMDVGAIDTYTPIHTGYVSFYARRTPAAGGGMVIALDGVCRGMYQSNGEPGPVYDECAKKIGIPQRKFRDYLSANL
jgi:hypothetical protein